MGRKGRNIRLPYERARGTTIGAAAGEGESGRKRGRRYLLGKVVVVWRVKEEARE